MTLLTAILALAAGIDEPRLCDGGVYDQFDFWLGEWSIEQRVHQPDGRIESYPARTTVTRSADGCVIMEHWRGTTRLFWYGMEQPQVMWGYSVRRVDPATGEWLISWIDGNNQHFGAPFVGRFSGKRGTFYQQGDGRRGRIEFVRKRDGTVLWTLASSPGGSESWQVLWEMDMRRNISAIP
jgi:hypothetical protein